MAWPWHSAYLSDASQTHILMHSVGTRVAAWWLEVGNAGGSIGVAKLLLWLHG